MKNQVTIVPADKLVIVDGVGLILDFEAAENIHAIQWLGNSGHCEYTDGRANRKLTAEDYEAEIAPFVALWEAEKSRIEQEQAKADAEYNKPENVAARALEAAKSERAALVEKATVEIDGMVFDADETSQNRLMRGIVCSIALGLAPDETTEWTLHDNTSAMITAQQMARALLAAGQYQTSVWRMPYEPQEEMQTEAPAE